MKIEYIEKDRSEGTTVSLRIEKDKTIWMSKLGLVKALITPTRVAFYNKLDNTYFDGDFSYLNKLLGTELNFEMVQNLLLGQAVFDLNKEPYYASSVANKYQLKPEMKQILNKFMPIYTESIFKDPKISEKIIKNTFSGYLS